ncbi:hypothetical protein [Alloprevotella tannerae]|uniref:hypothetical protein n=1 Tax=Alloprevotella tannerae TaxID=76122 RepID=UPI0028E3CE5C|nr:hypothetical protein [Alloprevotella tannerae]
MPNSKEQNLDFYTFENRFSAMKWAKIDRFIYLSTRFHRKEQSDQCSVAGAHAVCT